MSLITESWLDRLAEDVDEQPHELKTGHKFCNVTWGMKHDFDIISSKKVST